MSCPGSDRLLFPYNSDDKAAALERKDEHIEVWVRCWFVSSRESPIFTILGSTSTPWCGPGWLFHNALKTAGLETLPAFSIYPGILSIVLWEKIEIGST